ncbi:MAG: hypothetical protein RI905_374, partial [Pseudomonadota bacterium]
MCDVYQVLIFTKERCMKQKKIVLAVISALSVMATATAQTNSRDIELPRIDVVGS